MSKKMKLIMESWRGHSLLLEEVTQESVKDFLENIKSGKISDEKAVAVLNELSKDPAFAEAVAFFAAASSDDLEEGVIGDAYNAMGQQYYLAKLKGEDALKTMQQAAPNASKLASPLLGLAYFTASLYAGGSVDLGSAELAIKIGMQGLKGIDLIELAAEGGMSQ